MPYLDIVKLGNPALRQISEEIVEKDIKSQDTKNIINLLIDHMAHYGGVGIAAPQIGIQKRIFVYGFDTNPRYPGEGPIPLTVVINPKIIEQSSEQVDGFEGCLSVRTLRGIVPRSQSITIQGYDEHGTSFTKTAMNFEARIIQHEIDHLDGLTFIDRIKDFSCFGFSDELKVHGIIE